MQTVIRVQEQPFNPAEEYSLRPPAPECGALVTFIGTVRELAGEHLHCLTLEHYPGMTEKALQTITADAHQRWKLTDITVIHRIGRLEVNDPIVLVSVGSAHRADAFAACEFIMDFLKTQAPFWKKETTAQSDHWVEAKDSDQQALRRW